MRSSALVAVLVACSGEPEPQDSGPVETVTYAEAQAVFTDRCLACHKGEFAPEGMQLDAAYDNVVNVPSQQVPSLDRVEPGDPESSYLWLKLQGRAAEVGGEDSQMPFDGTAPLSDAELDVIEGWILSGAPPP